MSSRRVGCWCEWGVHDGVLWGGDLWSGGEPRMCQRTRQGGTGECPLLCMVKRMPECTCTNIRKLKAPITPPGVVPLPDTHTASIHVL